MKKFNRLMCAILRNLFLSNNLRLINIAWNYRFFKIIKNKFQFHFTFVHVQFFFPLNVDCVLGNFEFYSVNILILFLLSL